MKKTFLLIFILLMLPLDSAWGCFGPKLFVGADESPRQQLFYALISLYIKEKTGTESELVAAVAGAELQLLSDDQADLVLLSRVGDTGRPLLFQVDGLPQVASGPRPLDDLQFTLVAPALTKLSRLLTAEQFNPLVDQVVAGAPPAATARAFLTGQGWL